MTQGVTKPLEWPLPRNLFRKHILIPKRLQTKFRPGRTSSNLNDILIARRLVKYILVHLTNYGRKVKRYDSGSCLVCNRFHHKFYVKVEEALTFRSPCI